ncbi:KH domain-containing, RNA-binding, signal transduction-associated protein 3-like isoform X6 [Diprion similis]|uniref:KH domain-containing, RNA-binding, signal transduction-associated protein 3-like isoform X6 n=1 Tax=Diprion similis TaxID=362088 RepID=UPI001EF76610|nr:KH domain-containing, RNA-binding, signal transduction-associated protein 3-like isoform X6 [Diprion similis]
MKMDLGEEETEIGGTQHGHHPHYTTYAKHDSNGGGRGGVRGGGGGGGDGGERRMVDITRDKPIKVSVRVQVPVRDHPKFNFVGKLLGPKGNSLKRLQEDTMCKMAVLGRGSMKDRQKDYNDDIRQEQMWEMQILSTQGREGSQAAEAPSSPELSSDAANSPTAATTAASIEGQDSTPRPTPSPPNPATLKTQGTVLQTVTSTLGGRKRPLLPGGRPTMSPTKRTVMSLLARARAAQNKEPLPPPPSIVGAAHPAHPTHPQPPAPLIQAALQLPAGALQPGTQAPVGPQVSQLQLAAAQAASPHTTASQRQSILPPHTQHQVIPPAIHGLLHAHFRRAAAGATVVPILREDFMAGVNLV